MYAHLALGLEVYSKIVTLHAADRKLKLPQKYPNSTCGHSRCLTPLHIIINKPADTKAQVCPILHYLGTCCMAPGTVKAHVGAIACVAPRKMPQTTQRGKLQLVLWCIEGTLGMFVLAANVRPHILTNCFPPTDKYVIGPTPTGQTDHHCVRHVHAH